MVTTGKSTFSTRTSVNFLDNNYTLATIPNLLLYLDSNIKNLLISNKTSKSTMYLFSNYATEIFRRMTKQSYLRLNLQKRRNSPLRSQSIFASSCLKASNSLKNRKSATTISNLTTFCIKLATRSTKTETRKL